MAKEKLIAEVTRKYEDSYRRRTPNSRKTAEIASKYMPGGETRNAVWFSPYSIWLEKAEGCRFTDVDGHEYIDFNNCASAKILGHANPRVVAAVREQVLKGSLMGAFFPVLTRWAELLCDMVESVDKIRFGSTGSEGVLTAIHLARAATGKDLILKMDGCYHGNYDPVRYPSDAAGVPKSALAASISVPYNDNEAAERAIVENKDKLAAVIVEGAMVTAGCFPAREGYLKLLRRVTQENEVLLILDEVQTLRLAFGGVQKMCGIKADLTTMGKFIGGGYPVGAFGGREDLMQLCHPKAPRILHSGTFSGNPITATAGVATLEQLTDAEIARINNLGESFADGVRAVFKKLNIKGQVTGIGSLQNIHFSENLVFDWKSARETNKEMLHLYYLAMLERGVFSMPRGLYIISTPMTQKEIALAVKAVEGAMVELKPTIEDLWPELIGETPLVA
ncbi:MAG: aspartate aminotransferase family protein [Dehalococcoidales bacterium]